MNKGFTLAEVLITLGIIGIVAALTMPALISNHQKKVVVTRLEKFYTNINQAIKLSEAENGGCENWTYPSNSASPDIATKEFFDKYMRKYMQILSEESLLLNVYDPDGSDNYFTRVHVVYLSDGSAMTIKWYAGFDISFYPRASDLTSEVGILNSRSKFSFDFMKSASVGLGKCSVEPYSYKWDGTREGLKSHSRYGCSKSGNGNFCARLIQYDGWQIKDDYPW